MVVFLHLISRKIKKFGAITNVVEIFKGRDLTPPCVKSLEIHIPAITLTIEYNKKIPVSAIVAIVFSIARIILKHILEQINEIEVEKYCGKRYEREREKRNGKRRRKIVTLLAIILNLTRRGIGIPLYNIVEFESGNYQSDIKAVAVDSAIKMPADSRDEINRFTKSPSHQTIWRYTQEAGSKLDGKFNYNVYFSTDKTKLHSRGKKIELCIIEGKSIAVRTGVMKTSGKN